MGSEWGQLDNKRQKKMKKKIFSAFISTTRLQFPRTLPVFWLNQASHRNAKGTIGCRIECSIQTWGQNEASLTTKEKKNEKKDFFSIYQYHPVTVSTNIACFLVEPSVSQKCQGHHWMQNWMLYSTMGSEWGQLDNKKKKMKKKIFSAFITTTRLQFPRTLPVFWLNQASHRNAKGTIGCRIECSIQPWGQNEASLTTKKKKMKKKIFSLYHSSSHLKITRTLPVLWLNKASHRNAKGTIGCRIECSIQPWGQNEASWTTKDKKKNKTKIFSAFISTTRLQFPRTLPVLWLNKASHRNAKGTIGCRIECSIQTWGQNEASLTTKEKKNQKIDFFSIYQYHPVTVSTNIACFLVEPSVSQKCQGHHWMQNWMLYSNMGSEWGQLDNKEKKNEKKDFFVISQQLSLENYTNIACFVVEQSVSQKCQGHHWMQNWMLYSTMGSEWGQLDNKKKKNEKKDFFSIYQYHPVTVSTNIACFVVEQSVLQKCQGHHWMQNWMLYSTMGSEWGQLDNKKKKNEKTDFFSIYQYHPVTVSTNIACFLVEPSVSQKCQGHHWMQNWMLYSTMGSEWGQLDNKRQKKMKTIDFFSIYQYHPVTVSTNIACFVVEPSVSQKCQGHHWMQNWMLYSNMGSEWGQLDNKRKKKSKNRFFQHLSVPPGYSFHEHCLFSGWTKRLTEMPRAPLDAELNALFNHGVRMRPAWQQKKKKWKQRFFQHLSLPPGYRSHEHCVFCGWTKRLTEMPRASLDAELNALFNPAVGMRTASQQKKKKIKK